jgi:hypothetical protein
MLHIKIKTNTYANVLIKSKITQKKSRIFRCVTGRDKRDAKRVDYLTLAGNNELISHIEPLTLFCFFFTMEIKWKRDTTGFPQYSTV